jgi:hypothetical protein
MNKKYVITLTADERQQLEQMVSKGKAAARTLTRAWVLLKADASPGGPAWSDEQIHQTFSVSLVTLYRLRQRFVEDGFEVALARQRPCRSRPRRLDGEQEAYLIALACGSPPAGRRRWTLRLLANRMVELGHCDSVCPETVRQTLKKTN